MTARKQRAYVYIVEEDTVRDRETDHGTIIATSYEEAARFAALDWFAAYGWDEEVEFMIAEAPRVFIATAEVIEKEAL